MHLPKSRCKGLFWSGWWQPNLQYCDGGKEAMAWGRQCTNEENRCYEIGMQRLDGKSMGKGSDARKYDATIWEGRVSQNNTFS